MVHRLGSVNEVIAEGKNKFAYAVPGNSARVYLKRKPVVTACDGARCTEIKGIDASATTASINIFKRLRQAGLPTHFIEQISDNTILAEKLVMMPVEWWVRGVADGLFLKRNPYMQRGVRFSKPLVELFLKSDSLRDPLMYEDPVTGLVDLYRSDIPIEDGNTKVGELQLSENRLLPQSFEEIDRIKSLVTDAFCAIRDAFDHFGILLADMKIEGGFDLNGNFCIGDEISPDTCRLWIAGDPACSGDKDYYRRIPFEKDRPTPAECEAIAKKYDFVARITGHFHEVA